MAHYNNSVLSLTTVTTPDPYVTYSAATRQFYLVRLDRERQGSPYTSLTVVDIHRGRPDRDLESKQLAQLS
jgi:hypothetical protein